MNLDAMWEALEKYQQYAERHGFGDAWLRMTTERTSEAAYDAVWKSDVARKGRTDEVIDAVRSVLEAEEAVENAVRYISCAIEDGTQT